MTVLLHPPTRHVCDVPDGNHQQMTLAQCRKCGTWWFWDWSPSGDVSGWPYMEWRQVFWYHFRLRRRIKAASTDGASQ